MRLGILLIGLIVLVGLRLGAQTIESYELRAYTVGATSPLQTFTFPLANVTCNLAPITSGSTINPTTALWDDPVNAGRDCRFVQGSGILFSVSTPGNYEEALVAVNQAGLSPESTRAHFSKLDPAGAPSGLRLRR